MNVGWGGEWGDSLAVNSRRSHNLGQECSLSLHPQCFHKYLDHFEGKIKRFIESSGNGSESIEGEMSGVEICCNVWALRLNSKR